MFSFFRRSRPTISPRDAAWRRLAVRLELRDEAVQVPRLCELLDLPLGTEVGPVYGLELDPTQSSLFFDYREQRSGPTGQVDALVSGCTLSCHEPIAGMSLRASQKLHPVLESLGASAIGGVVVELGNADFNDRVSLFARDDAAARQLLTPAAQKALLGVLYTRGLEPTLLLGERDLVATNRTSAAEPTDLVALEALAVNLLTLYTTLRRPDPSADPSSKAADETPDDPSTEPSTEPE